jgi:hydroxymethylglutaryl-CoA synthase
MNSNNKGIIDIQLYYPKQYVDQADLEEYDKIGKGKYTIGLGQHKMAFVGDREDINSICMSVLEKLLERNNINPKDVGRLEIGTETQVDKSKSIKTHLMGFFKDNYDIEGVATTNACYGGTNALFNTLNWLYSDFWDGRYGIVICADIAIYAKGNARSTGGCGAVAILLGKGASITFDRERSTYINNVYDFYKPNPTSEYPTVDGVFSMNCYFKALEKCYETLLSKNPKITLENYDYFCFHTPFAKMVEKAFYRLICYDMIFNKGLATTNMGKYYKNDSKDLFALLSNLDKKNISLDEKLITEVRKIFNKVLKDSVEPGLFLGKNLGNIYTGSLYIGLMSLILDPNLDLSNKKIFMFSYGSGCAASIFSLNISPEYKSIVSRNSDTISGLGKRIKVSPNDFEKILLRKEQLYLKYNYLAEDDLTNLFENAYFLEKIDDKWRRYYRRKNTSDNNGRTIEFNKLSNKEVALGRLTLIRNQLISGNINNTI